jgi:hypothetical protein
MKNSPSAVGFYYRYGAYGFSVQECGSVGTLERESVGVGTLERESVGVWERHATVPPSRKLKSDLAIF